MFKSCARRQKSIFFERVKNSSRRVLAKLNALKPYICSEGFNQRNCNFVPAQATEPGGNFINN